MDDNTNPTPQETPEDAAKSFGDEWQQIPSASAEEWSKEVPPAPIPPEPPTETDRWGAAQPSAAIVLLVLLLCCVCPIAIFLGFFSTAWQNSALLLLVM